MPSLFIIAADPASWTQKIDTVGARLIDLVSLQQGAACLQATLGADVLLLDCRGALGDCENLIASAKLHAKSWGAVFIAIADLHTLDLVDALATGPNTLVLCEPDDHEIAITLKLALSRRDPRPIVRDGGAGEPAHLNRLSDELDRLSGMIESLVREVSQAPSMVTRNSDLRAPGRSFAAMPMAASGAALNAQQVRALLRARRLRDQLVPGDLFADPAWDMMLDLMAARLEGNRVSVSSLCIAAAVPPTTALRWIRQLTDRGLLERHADDADGRRVFITLSPEGYRAIESWFVASRPLIIEVAG